MILRVKPLTESLCGPCPNSYVEDLTPQSNSNLHGAFFFFFRTFGLEEVMRVGPHDGINALVKRDAGELTCSQSHSSHKRTWQKCGCLQPGRELSYWYLDFGLPASRNVKKEIPIT